MKKNKLSSSNNLFASEEMAVALASLRNLITTSRSTETDSNTSEIDGKRLNEIFVKTKKQKIRDLFIQKLKRGLVTNEPHQVGIKQEVKGPFGVLIEAIQFPQNISHIVLLTNVIVVLILMVLATFEGFIDNFRASVNYQAVFAVKIICLIINILYFILKCTNKSFGTGQNLKYIHEVLRAYASSGRLFVDIITIAIQIVTLIIPNVMAISGVFFFYLIIVLFLTLSDLIQIEAAYLHSEKAILLWGLVKICLSNIIFAHCLASVILAMSWTDLQKNWMTRAGINEEQWQVKYFYAYYWATTIMMTVGFGDVLPGNPREVIITTFMEMFSCILLGYNISQIGHLISQLREKDQIVNRKIAIFDRMVKSRKGQPDPKFEQLKKNIYTHIKQLNNGDNNMQHQLRGQLLAELPEHLRKAYYQEANQQIFPTVVFFNRLKPSTVQQMAPKFESKFFYAGEKLVESDEKIMILEQGSIGLGYKKRGSFLNGEMFDEISSQKEQKTILLTTSFLSMIEQANYDLIAKKHSIVWGISRDDFFETLSESAIDFQYYFSVLHKNSINSDEWSSILCTRCSTEKIKSFHCVYNCPRIVYIPLKQIPVLRDISGGTAVVSSRQRRSNKKCAYSKSSALMHKKTFNKLFHQIGQERNKKAQILALFDNSNSHNHHLEENHIISMRQYQNIGGFTRDNLMDIMQAAIKRYETGYEPGFWDLECDQIHNYQFYFPNLNANRLQKKAVSKFMSFTGIFGLVTKLGIAKKTNQFQFQSENSIVLNV